MDGNDLNRRVLSTCLQDWGVETVAAGSVAETLAALADESPYDALLVNARLSEADRTALALSMRGRPGAPPILLCVDLLALTSASKDRFAGLDVAEVLTRPIKPAALGNALSRLRLRGGPDVPLPPEAKRAEDVPLLAETCPLEILLVDDNQTNRKLGRKVLERLGYAAALAEDGAAAVAACAARRFDVVLMDIEMPEMNGLEACATIRDRTGPNRPLLVALTANAIVGDRERYLASGFDGYLSKPLDVEELRGQLQRAHRMHGGT